MTTATVPAESTPTRSGRLPLPALAGIAGLAAAAGGVVLFGDPLAGSETAADVAGALAGTPAQTAAVLFGLYALLGIAVTGALAARLGRGSAAAAPRLLPVLGAAHLLLMTAFYVAPAAAVTVGTLVLEGGVSPVAAETALLLMNVVHPMAAWVGAGFLIAVAVAAREAKGLRVASTVFAVGLLLPPIGWAVTYLMAFWFAGVGIWLWRRG